MIRAIERNDILKLNIQPSQAFYRDHMHEAVSQGNLNHSYSYTENGQVKACIGMLEFWKGRATVWAMIGDVNNWIAFHRLTKKLLESYSEKLDIIRLEMTTEVGFVESERWASMLGFIHESTMSNFGVDGKDHKMWVRLWQQQYQ
jgi:hypothetical protein